MPEFKNKIRKKLHILQFDKYLYYVNDAGTLKKNQLQPYRAYKLLGGKRKPHILITNTRQSVIKSFNKRNQQNTQEKKKLLLTKEKHIFSTERNAKEGNLVTQESMSKVSFQE